MFLTQGFASEPRYLSLLMTIYVLFCCNITLFKARYIKKSPTMLLIELLAEREGFKPPERTSRSPDFESGPIGHSGISPELRVQR